MESPRGLPRLVLDSDTAMGKRLAKRLGLVEGELQAAPVGLTTPRLPPLGEHLPAKLQGCYTRPRVGRQRRSASPRCSPTSRQQSSMQHHSSGDEACVVEANCKADVTDTSSVHVQLDECSKANWTLAAHQDSERRGGWRKRGNQQRPYNNMTVWTTSSAATSYGGMEQLCRDTFQSLVDKRMKSQAEFTKHHAEERRTSAKVERQRAKAWKVKAHEKEKKIIEESKRQLKDKEDELFSMGRRLSPVSDRSGSPEKVVVREPRGHSVTRNARKSMRAKLANEDTPKIMQEGPTQSQIAARMKNMQSRFEALPKEEQQLIEAMLQRHVGDDGTLSEHDATQAICDCGMRGLLAAERKELSGLCQSKCSGKNQVAEPCEFAELFNACRRSMVRLRLQTLKKHMELCSRDWEGRIVFEHLQGAIKMILPWELLDPADDSQKTAEIKDEVKKAVLQIAENEGHVAQVVENIVKLSEDKLRIDIEKSRAIQERFDLSKDCMQNHGSQIVALWRFFTQADYDGSGSLDQKEVGSLLAEFKVTPKTVQEKRQVMGILAEITQVDFAGFLTLIDKIRDIASLSSPYVVREEFDYYIVEHADIPDHSTVNAEGLRKLLEDANVIPSIVAPPAKDASSTLSERQRNAQQVMAAATNKEQDSLGRTLVEHDPEGIGLFTFGDVMSICTRIREFAQYQEVLKEERAVRECNFPAESLREIKNTFNEIDVDHGSTLDKKEVRAAMKLLKVAFDPEWMFHAVFRMLDADDSGQLDFVEFVEMMKMVRDKEGVVRDDNLPVSTLQELTHIDLVILLEVFGLAPEVSDAMPKAELISKASEFMQVSEKVQLGPVMSITTFGDLIAHARHLNSKRPKEVQKCECGNEFIDDAIFCRKCGTKRPEAG